MLIHNLIDQEVLLNRAFQNRIGFMIQPLSLKKRCRGLDNMINKVVNMKTQEILARIQNLAKKLGMNTTELKNE